MRIDENGDEYDLSDHKLITVNFGYHRKLQETKGGLKYKETHYLKIGKHTTKEYVKNLEKN